MRRGNVISGATVTAGLLLTAALAAAASPVAEGEALLPPSGAVTGLRADGDPQRFRGAELYGHIDGGAEPFLELGFDHLLVQDYDAGRDAVTVEIYVMDDPTAAVGIYLMKCGREERIEGLAARHSATRNQVLLVGGNVFASVYDAVGNGRAQEPIERAARALAAVLPPVVMPPEFALLPEKGRIAGSLRVSRGPFTLQRVFTFGEGDVLSLGGRVTAVSAEYDDGHGGTVTRIVAPYSTADAAKAALATLSASFDPGLTIEETTAERLTFIDWSGRLGVVQVEGSTLTADLNLEPR